MDNLSIKIELYLGRAVDFNSEVILRDKGSGPYIEKWNTSDKAKPTDEQLNAFESDAVKQANNLKADANRKAEYLSWEEQLDYIYHNGINKWKTDHIKPIKDKYPKE